MKITFEGTISEIFSDMTRMVEVLLTDVDSMREVPVAPILAPAPVVDKPVDEAAANKARAAADIRAGISPPIRPTPHTQMTKPAVEKKARTEKQKANDERLRAAALAKKAAGLKVGDKNPAPPKQEVKPVEKAVEEPVEELFEDPDEIVKLRQKTLNDLRTAYANGHQQEVFELLSRFGDGAKSFRELKPEAFLPIREAIDKGALT